MQIRKTAWIATIGLIVIIAISVGIAYYHPATTLNEICTIVSYTHSYPYNPDNNSSYSYTNTTSVSTVQIYTGTVVQTQSSESVVTITGTTLTASGKPGISWNETVCTFVSTNS